MQRRALPGLWGFPAFLAGRARHPRRPGQGEGQPARGLTTAARKTTAPEKSSQIAKTKGRFTIISKGGGGGGGFKAAPHISIDTAAASVPFSLTSTKSCCITPIR